MVVALTAASCIASSSAAQAAYVTDYQDGLLLGSWNQSLAPTPISSSAGQYTVVGIYNGIGEAFGYNYAYWYPGSNFGGLVVGGPLSLINTSGPQSYSGGETAPVFVPGSYVESDGSIVTITVPEPATWAMMLLGLGVIGFTASRRRTVSVTYG